MLVNPKGWWLVDQISRTDQEISLGAHKLSVPHPYPLIFSAAGFGPSKCLAWIFTMFLYQLTVGEPPAFPTGGAGRGWVGYYFSSKFWISDNEVSFLQMR